MINTSLVKHVLVTTGLISSDQTTKIEPYLNAVCDEFTKKLKSPKYETESTVINACAAVTYYRFNLSDCLKSEEFTSLKAGDITIKQSHSSKMENAVKYRDDAVLSAVPYLKDFDFVFRTVRS